LEFKRFLLLLLSILDKYIDDENTQSCEENKSKKEKKNRIKEKEPK
jgi:hypothetical protein